MKSLINRINATILSEKRFIKNIKYNKHGYYLHNKNKRKNAKVSVIVPVFNAEKSMVKTIDSIINQSIGFKDIELLIIDDKSQDQSRSIILNYAKKHANIIPVFLKENTGSPSAPRNLGIDLAKGKYITFVDSDDWLDKNGIEVLYNLLEKTDDNYAVGKTIKVDDKGKYIIGEYNSWKTRESIDPYSINQIFNHLGPTGRMMNTAMLQEKDIKFPDMKFAEDKQFFIDVLTQCETISTSKDVIYYANRYKDNVSFTTTTTVFEKTDTNISLINYVIKKNLPIEVEKMILNRLYEFDCIMRLFNRGHFLNSKDKERYFKKFSEVLATTENLRYDFTENFFEPWHKVLVALFKEERYDDIVKLIDWNRKEAIKDYYIDEANLPYYRLPFDDTYNLARMSMLALHHASIKENDNLIVQFSVYGEYTNKVESLVIRQRNNDLNKVEFPIERKRDNVFEVVIAFDQLDSLVSASHSIYIKYFNYLKIPIKMDVRNIIKRKKRKIDFYTTVSDNFGVNIK